MSVNDDYFKSREFKELLDNYEASIKAGNSPFMDADDLVDIADYYNQNNRMDEAIEVVEYSLRLYPHATLPNVFMARQALMQSDFMTACEYADNIENKDDPDYHYLRAEIMLAEGDVDKADRYLRDYAMTVEADEYSDFVKDCANLYVDYNVYEKAYEWMMRNPKDHSTDAKELMAFTLMGLGKNTEATKLFNELIDVNPYSAKYWKALAGIQIAQQDYSSSITSSEYAIAINPQDPEALLAKASALFQLENFEEAEKYYERFIKANDYMQVEMHLVYQELAFCYSAQKKLEKALKTIEKAEKLTTDHPSLLVIKGHILLENDRLAEAEKTWKQAIKEANFSPSIMLRIFISLYDNHYVKSCYQLLKRFCNVYANDRIYSTEGYSYLALCCHDLKLKDEFMKNLEIAVKRNPQEAKSVLAPLFPPGTPVEDYINLMTIKLSK